MTETIFEFDNYQSYLRKAFDRNRSPRGQRSRLAQHLSCQTSFLSQVLTDRAHLSLEHALKTSEFLEFSEEERDYFMLLVQKAKAGSVALENYFDRSLSEIRRKRQLIQERIKVRETLSEEDHATYYSNWWYAAIHILVAFPEVKTEKELAERLRLPRTVIQPAIEFLLSSHLIKNTNEGFQIGKARIHLSPDSPLIARHHSNWRTKAVEAIERPHSKDLHYSGVVGISRRDAMKIRKMLLELLQRTEEVVADSKEEAPYVLLLDLFEL